MRPRARLIYNPTAGKEAMRQQLPDILDILDLGGYEVSCAMTHGAHEATEAARQACLDGYEYIFAAGGDGTIYEVINGMGGMEHRPTLGVIPAGTTNDLARALKLPRNLKQAAQVLSEGHTMPLDLGRAGEQYFVNIASMGRLTEITYETPSRLKTYLGRLAYYVKGLEKLPSAKPVHLKVESRDFTYEGAVSLLLVANSNSVAGFEKMTPEASLSDGIFDVLLVKACSLPDLVRLATQAMKGEHFQNEHVLYFQTNELQVDTLDQVKLNLDGEYGGQLPQTMTCLPQHLNILVPRW